MSRDSTRDLRKMGRRNFLRSLAGIGISGATLRYMTKDALAEVTDNPKKEVPRLRSLRHANHQEVVEEGKPPEVEPVYDTIPRDEWAVTESAFDAERKINKALRQIDDTGLVLAGVTETTSGQHSKKTVEVRYIERELRSGGSVKPNVPAEEISKELPSKVTGTAGKGDNAVTVRGIPVTMEKVSQELHGCDKYDDNYRPVPGGCRMRSENKGCGTICTPAYDNERDEYVMVTAGHAIEGTDSGKDVWQPYDSYSSIGESDKGDWEDHPYPGWTSFDAATIDLKDGPYDGVDHIYGFADEPSGYVNDVEIYGTIAWISIEDMVGNSSYELTKRGSTTGKKSGHIYWASSDAKVFETTAKTKNGDSGGPHFNIDGDFALIAGVHNYDALQRDPGSGATAIEAVNNQFNLTI